MCRHPRLGLRKPQVTSSARLQAFTKINIAKFFDIFEPVLRLINFFSHRLFNYEETGLSVVQHKVCKVVSLKGKRRISVISREGSLMSIFICKNAAVMYVLFWRFPGTT